jgi:hypothetical protein
VTHDAALINLNDRIPEAGNRGADPESRAFLDSILAPVFAFRRASGTLTDRAGYLDSLASGGDRVNLGSYDITLMGEHRAIVSCRIQMTVGNVLREFDNLRVFVKNEDTEWQLLAWANELIGE